MLNYVKYAHLDQLNCIYMLSAFNVIFHLTLNIIWCQVMVNNACIRYSLDGFSFSYYLPHNYVIVDSSNYFSISNFSYNIVD